MTHARPLTPTGRGAIAVIEVAGPEACSAIGRWFAAANGKRPDEQPINAIRFGRWHRRDRDTPDHDSPGEELVVVRTSADRFEVHCHGGVAAPAAVLAALAVEDVVVGPTAHESLTDQAHRALSRAPTERVARVLLDQFNGALEQEIEAILAALDAGDRSAADSRLNGLLRQERLGRRLTTPWRVVLAGPPNVGKSSLINALVGYERAIVYDQPGTTRDVVTASTAIDGWPVTLADTAGIRHTEDPLEAAGVDLARQMLAGADVLVLVREAAALVSEESDPGWEELLAGTREGVAVIEVANKADLLPAGATLPQGVLATAAPTGDGVPGVLAAIGRALAIEAPPAGSPVPFTPHQFQTLRAAAESSDVTARTLLLSLLAEPKP